MTPKSWFLAAALVGLGTHRAATPSVPFTASDLAGWVAAFGGRKNAQLGIDGLSVHGYVQKVPQLRPTTPVRPDDRWTLTATGAAAARSAAQSTAPMPMRAYGPRADIAALAKLDPFQLRLWNLLRIRRKLTTDEASSLLTDAGEDVARARRKAGELLLAWSRQCPHAVRLSAKRVDGAKAYILAVDIGAQPPDLKAGRKGGAV